MVTGADSTINGEEDFTISYEDLGIVPQEKTLRTTGFEAEFYTDETIGTVTGVRNGEAADFVWKDAENGTYGWYVEITDANGGLTRSDVQTVTIEGIGESETGTSGSSSDIPVVQKPTVIADTGAEVTLGQDGTTATIKVQDGYQIVDVLVNGVSQGAVTEIQGLKTGDTIEVKTSEASAELTKEDIMTALESQKLVARSKLVTLKNGKKAIKITWKNKDGALMDFDGVEIYRSTKRNSGYGKKPIFTTTGDAYFNTAIKDETRYFYKVRGFVTIDGQKYFTDFSLKAIRTVK